MPVTMSIEWRPLRDSYYVVASLQPGGGGLRQPFARQSTLRELQSLARGNADRPLVGLLLGERLDCPTTLTPYLLIESHVEVALATFDETTVSDAIRTLRSRVGRRDMEVLGWFCSSRSADAVVSRTIAAVHAACFTERWQTVLAFGNDGKNGAFFLHDSTAARWFHAPFYEVTNAKANSRAPKPTCVAWPAYLTTASVALLDEAARVPSPPPRELDAAPASAHPQHSAAPTRPVVKTRRTPTRDAFVEVGRVAVAARRSALDLARVLGGRAAAVSRDASKRIGRMRATWAANAAQKKAEATAARAREDERRAKEAAERRAIREEAQRRAAEAEQRRAVEAESRRAAEMEARRRDAEEAERRRAAEAEARRQAAEAEAQRRAEAAEAQRAADAEAQRKAAEEAQLRAAEAEARRMVAEEAQRRAAAEEQRRAAVAEARRLAEEAEAERQRKAAEAEEDGRRKAAEAEALRISVEVAAIRERLARAPVEGSRRETSKAATQMPDVEDTTASDGPYRYLALARREGFEVSEKIERGTPEHPETVWLLHEKQSGLRLIVVTTDEAVREASLHYNLRAEDDSILQNTVPEHCDLESRTIYRREPCLDTLRARCRRLRATGTLERDWKVVPTFEHSGSPQ